MDFTRNCIVSFIILLLCVFLSAYYSRRAPTADRHHPDSRKWFETEKDGIPGLPSLMLGYYDESCPMVEQIIRRSLQDLYNENPSVAPAVIRMFFHDCFVQGCDASVLLDQAGEEKTEKDAVPNQTLKGFDEIDIIKSQVEAACPGIVSCADIIVLAARDSILLAGGPFYPLLTGRMDSTTSVMDKANNEIPSPFHDHNKIVKLFAAKGFNDREMVSLLGAHSTGTIHCQFISIRLDNFSGTNAPDPSIDHAFLEDLRSTCNATNSTEEPGRRMDFEGRGKNFGTVYYRSLLQGKGLLFSDQQLMTEEGTSRLVTQYASDMHHKFEIDFTRAMVKLSNIQDTTSSLTEVRMNCRKQN